MLPRYLVSKTSIHPLVKNLFITDIGFYPNAQYHYIERKNGSNQYILIYCVKGMGFVEIDGKKLIITENNILFIPKGIPHVYGSSTENPWDIYWIHFHGENVIHYFPQEYSNTISTFPVPISKFPILFNLFNTMILTLDRGYTLNNIIYTSQIFSHFLSSIFFLSLEEESYLDKNTKYINETLEFMKDNISKLLTLEILAKHINLSKSHLTYIFKENTGHTPIDFFIRLKIQHACNHLDLSKNSISEISNKLGYNDPYYFSRIFKKVMGMSPSAYRDIKKG
ncbi:AraC family transcriptional regulator [Clostridium sediminicola]|uniref:AraC family transcriptional regulator n=1 Tax=Clostridium sediminicola TaxID=3114879 RepID=UPI003D183CE4